MQKNNIELIRETIIRRWMPRFFGRSVGYNCILCLAYNSRKGIQDCAGCPIMEFTVIGGCAGTPYWRFVEAIGLYNNNLNHDLVPHAVREELPFLFKILRIERKKCEKGTQSLRTEIQTSLRAKVKSG